MMFLERLTGTQLGKELLCSFSSRKSISALPCSELGPVTQSSSRGIISLERIVNKAVASITLPERLMVPLLVLFTVRT